MSRPAIFLISLKKTPKPKCFLFPLAVWVNDMKNTVGNQTLRAAFEGVRPSLGAGSELTVEEVAISAADATAAVESVRARGNAPRIPTLFAKFLLSHFNYETNFKLQ